MTYNSSGYVNYLKNHLVPLPAFEKEINNNQKSKNILINLNISQEVKSSSINYSLNTENITRCFFDDNRGGLCAGFSMLWILCMINSNAKKNKPQIFYQNIYTMSSKLKQLNIKFEKNLIEDIEKIDINSFYKTIEKFYNNTKTLNNYNIGYYIASPLAMSFKRDHKTFIDHVKNLNNISTISFISNKILIIDIFNKKCDLSFFCDEITKIKQNHLCAHISTSNHSMAIFIQKINENIVFHFYDPNTSNGHQSFSFSILDINWKKTFNFEFHKLIFQTKYFLMDNDEAKYLVLKLFDVECFLKTPKEEFGTQNFNNNFIYCNLKNYLKISEVINMFVYNDEIFVLRYLIKNYPAIDLNLENYLGFTSLIISAYCNSIYSLKFLLSFPQIDPNKTTYKKHNPPLHIAVHKNFLNYVEIILNDSRIDVNKINRDGNTALHFAAMQGNFEILKILLSKNNIDISPKNFKGETPLKIAENNKYDDIIKYIKMRKSIYYNHEFNKVFVLLESFLLQYKENEGSNSPLNIEKIDYKNLSTYSRKKLGMEIIKTAQDYNITEDKFISLCCKVVYALREKKLLPSFQDMFKGVAIPGLLKAGLYKESIELLREPKINELEIIELAKKFSLNNKPPQHLMEFIFLIINKVINKGCYCKDFKVTK